ncbi:CaiB/BaiF CoA transferase family protein [Marinibaculum pumilum]|uniref:CaiB/BaiF CoA transferase family protein n=1 Tax=Marinibaculum pumilum TaxID=1766165 RepID=A0ABV7L0V8_9PROT
MPGPLHGFTILDLSAMLSGPWCTSILGDQGADVIKIEVPGKGDHTRALRNQRGGLPANFLQINRNKRSLTLDMKNPAGRQVFLDLAARADVVVQNFRPGVVDRLGIGYDAVRGINPRIVYLSLSGFGEAGPYSHKPVYDPVIQALSGLTTIQAGADEARPKLVRTVLPDKLSAVTASQAITAALLSRERTGEGQHIRLSMLDAVMAFLWASDYNAQTFPDRPTTNQRAASFIDLIYETADGYMTVAVMSNKEWEALTRAFDKPEWLTDPRFATPSARDNHINERLEMTQDVLRTRTTAEWLEVLEREGVPCAPALTRNAAVEHEQVQASGILVEVEHPTAGRLRHARPAARFESTPADLRRGAPELGQHNEEILRELGRSEAEIEALRASGAIGSEALQASAAE